MPQTLSNATLRHLPAGLAVPGYDRNAVRPGIAHLGVGNFHRAHMALYVDRCLHRQDGAGWGLLGIGVIDNEAERAKASTLERQDGLYTLAQHAPNGTVQRRVVGSIVEYRHAPRDPEGAIARLADPAIRIVSLTITEGGYRTDVPASPLSAFGLITGALARRRGDGTPPFTILSCDNLQHNGAVARRAVVAHARSVDPELAALIEREVDFPSCMVDRITPGVTPGDKARLNAASGVEDGAPVFCEDFLQWVIEDRFRHGRPALETAGVQFTDDVAPYEQVKLRLLNASHSMLAYPAMLAGLRLVPDAMAEPRLRRLLHGFMTHDAMPHLAAPPGLPLEAYRDSVLSRFTNPAIADQIARLCSDGAAKLPVFVGPTLLASLAEERDVSRPAFLLACYFRHLGGVDEHGARFAPAEPGLTDDDLRLAASSDPRQRLRVAPFRDWRLDEAAGFLARFSDLDEAIAARGVLAVAEDLS